MSKDISIINVSIKDNTLKFMITQEKCRNLAVQCVLTKNSCDVYLDCVIFLHHYKQFVQEPSVIAILNVIKNAMEEFYNESFTIWDKTVNKTLYSYIENDKIIRIKLFNTLNDKNLIEFGNIKFK